MSLQTTTKLPMNKFRIRQKITQLSLAAFVAASASCTTQKAPLTQGVVDAKNKRIKILAESRGLGRREALEAEYGLHLISHDSHSQYDGINGKGAKAGQRHINDLMRKIEGDSRIEKILIFSHGGLTPTSASWKSGLQICEEVSRTSGGKIFPIGITWKSSLPATFFDRVAYERNGISYRQSGPATSRAVTGWLTQFPSYLAEGFARFPRSAGSAVENAFQNWDGAYQLLTRNNPTGDRFPVKYTYYQNLIRHFDSGAAASDSQYSKGLSNTNLQRPRPVAGTVPTQPWFRTSLGRMVEKYDLVLTTQNVISSPVKLVTLPLIDGVGRPAWENMSKRTAGLVRDDLMAKSVAGINEKPVWTLFERLSRRRKGIELELYGHSMGSMVFNEVIREVQEKRLSDPRVSRFVYMAAACSINDFNSTVGRYLMEPQHSQAHFHNLCLHPDCEVREAFQKVPFLNVAVSGSLLVWIDSFYENPTTPLDRTLGSYVNAISNWRHLPQTQNMTVKAFGMQYSEVAKIEGSGWHEAENYFYNAGPQKHGEFDNFHFWKAEYYEAKEPEVMPSYIRFR